MTTSQQAEPQEEPAVNRRADRDLVYEVRGGVAVVTFDRPDTLNAFRTSTHQQLSAALARAESDDSVRVVIMTGNGRAFSSGQDLDELKEILSHPDDLLGRAVERVEMLQDLTRQLLAIPKPTIAAINGVAVGLGAELALACDLRIASTTASVGFVEATRGLFQTNGVMYLLPRLVGYGRAMELLLTGRIVPADEADRIGLVGRVVAPDQLMATAIETAQQLERNAPISVRLVKEVLAQTYDLDLPAMLELEVKGMVETLKSADLRDGVDSFIDKRPPTFRGS